MKPTQTRAAHLLQQVPRASEVCAQRPGKQKSNAFFLRDALHPEVAKNVCNRWTVQLMVSWGNSTPGKAFWVPQLLYLLRGCVVAIPGVF